eukprot:s5106_g1.t1
MYVFHSPEKQSRRPGDQNNGQLCSPGGQQPPIRCRGHGCCAKVKRGGDSLAGASLDVGLVGLVGQAQLLAESDSWAVLVGHLHGTFSLFAPKHRISYVIRSRFHVAYALAIQKHPCVLWPPIMPRESQ